MDLLLGIFCSFFVGIAQASYTPGVSKVARITYSGGVPSVGNQYDGNWLTGSPTDAGIGSATVLIKSGIFPSSPACWCNSEAAGTNCQAVPSSATSVAVTTYSLAIGLLGVLLPADSTFTIWCWR